MIWLDAVKENLPGPVRLRVSGRSMLPTLHPGDEVIVHPATAEALTPGDWVVVRGAQGAFLHRYLGRRDGHILTKGDGHRALDPSWPPEAVLGRVVEAQRDGRCFYRRTPGQLRRERLLAAGHQALGSVWGVLRRVKALLLALCAIVLAVTLAWAAVKITGFTAEVGSDFITLNWETASETDNLGFRLWRSLDELDDDAYADISGFIASLDEGAGAFYEYEDIEVTPGITYYYKLQDVPDDGSSGDYTDPISATIPTPTPTPTATPTVTPTPLPTSTPNPNVRFWADETDLAAGECATLYWQTNNILAVHFDGIGVTGDGERLFCPCETESHTLRVKYLNGTSEDFVITLNVTGQCGVTPTSTPTLAPREIGDRPTSTPRPTWTPDLTATASTEAYIATATASTEAYFATATASAAAQALETVASPVATLTPASDSSESLVEVEAASVTPSLLLTRGQVEGETPGVPVEKMLSIWMLIVGGIVGAGFIGAGILMWKRQQ
ncbi:MAG: hypothetical protein ACP5J4_14740 [Anaerolineae bacterium]